MTVRSADLRVLTNMPKNNKAQETNNSLRLSSRDGPKVPSMGGGIKLIITNSVIFFNQLTNTESSSRGH